MGKKLLAAVLGGLAFFAWSSIAHLLLGLGNVGISEIPNEQAVVGSVKANITQPGMYIFPGFGLGPDATQSQRMAKMPELAPENESRPGRDHGCAS